MRDTRLFQQRIAVLWRNLYQESKALASGPSEEELDQHLRSCLASALAESGRCSEAELVRNCPRVLYLEHLKKAFETTGLDQLVMAKIGDFASLPHCPNVSVLEHHFQRAVSATLDHYGDRHQAETVINASVDELRPLLSSFFDIGQPYFIMFQMLNFRLRTT